MVPPDWAPTASAVTATADRASAPTAAIWRRDRRSGAAAPAGLRERVLMCIEAL